MNEEVEEMASLMKRKKFLDKKKKIYKKGKDADNHFNITLFNLITSHKSKSDFSWMDNIGWSNTKFNEFHGKMRELGSHDTKNKR